MSPETEITGLYKAGCLGLCAHSTHPVPSWITGQGFPARTAQSTTNPL